VRWRTRPTWSSGWPNRHARRSLCGVLDEESLCRIEEAIQGYTSCEPFAVRERDRLGLRIAHLERRERLRSRRPSRRQGAATLKLRDRDRRYRPATTRSDVSALHGDSEHLVAQVERLSGHYETFDKLHARERWPFRTALEASFHARSHASNGSSVKLP